NKTVGAFCRTPCPPHAGLSPALAHPYPRLYPQVLALLDSRAHCAVLPFTQTRSYAKQKGRGEPTDQKQKGSHGMSSTDTLVPGSQRIAAGEEYTKTETKMKTTADWYRKEVAALETRATGRVTPAVLAPVRVQLPGHESADGKGVRLEEIATVGVKEGTMLLVTVFEEHTLKYVEQAIYDAKLPGITPRSRTAAPSKYQYQSKLPVATSAHLLTCSSRRPTVETRLALYTNAQRQAEDTRVQIRKHHQAALKKGKYGKHSPQIQEVSSGFFGW
ncbi:Ribosome-recycling factor, partial [Grifola frondosa]